MSNKRSMRSRSRGRPPAAAGTYRWLAGRRNGRGQGVSWPAPARRGSLARRSAGGRCTQRRSRGGGGLPSAAAFRAHSGALGPAMANLQQVLDTSSRMVFHSLRLWPASSFSSGNSSHSTASAVRRRATRRKARGTGAASCGRTDPSVSYLSLPLQRCVSTHPFLSASRPSWA